MNATSRIVFVALAAFVGLGVATLLATHGLARPAVELAVSGTPAVPAEAATGALAGGPLDREPAGQRRSVVDRIVVVEATAAGQQARPDAVVETMRVGERQWQRPARDERGWVVPVPGEYHVRVTASGFAAREQRAQFRGTTLEIVLRPLGSVQVTFVDGSGAPVPGVHVALSCRTEPNEADASPLGLGGRQVSDAAGQVRWERVAGFLEYRYAVTSGHQVECEPLGGAGVSGTFVPDGGPLQFCCVVAGSQIAGRLPLLGGEQDVRVRIMKIDDSSDYDPARRRPCFAAGRSFLQVGAAHPTVETSDGVFCFGGMEPGDYVLRARWRDAGAQRWTFVTAFARMPENGGRIDLGTLHPLRSAAQSFRVLPGAGGAVEVPEDLLSSLRTRVAVNSGSAVHSVEQLSGWIDDTFDVQGCEPVTLVGLPAEPTQFELRDLVAGDSPWVFGRTAKVATDRDAAAPGVVTLAVPVCKTVAVRVRARSAIAAVPGASALAMVVREADGEEPAQIISTPMARAADGDLVSTVSTGAGRFSAYVFVETPGAQAAGFVTQITLSGDGEILVPLESSVPVSLELRGAGGTDVRTLDFGPSGFGHPVSCAVARHGVVTVNGIPQSLAVDCWGLPADVELVDPAGRRAIRRHTP